MKEKKKGIGFLQTYPFSLFLQIAFYCLIQFTVFLLIHILNPYPAR